MTAGARTGCWCRERRVARGAARGAVGATERVRASEGAAARRGRGIVRQGGRSRGRFVLELGLHGGRCVETLWACVHLLEFARLQHRAMLSEKRRGEQERELAARRVALRAGGCWKPCDPAPLEGRTFRVDNDAAPLKRKRHPRPSGRGCFSASLALDEPPRDHATVYRVPRALPVRFTFFAASRRSTAARNCRSVPPAFARTS